MRYLKTITLKDGRTCTLRNAEESDGKAVLANFILTHEQTDYLLSSPDESTMTAEQEGRFLQECTMDEMIEHCAQFVDEVNKNMPKPMTKDEYKQMMRGFFPMLKRWRK